MANSDERFARRRVTFSYISVVISIALVLLLLGLASLLPLLFNKISDEIKESIGFVIWIKDDVNETGIDHLRKKINAAPFVKASSFIDKETAAENLKNDLGEDFIELLGYNPLYASIDLNLKAEFVHPDSIPKIQEKLESNQEVLEVYYKESQVEMINKNLGTILLILGGFVLITLVIAIALINNSIRLAIYSKRFLIRSMQLVGATQGFIRRPFVFRGLAHGIYGAIIAIGLLIGIIYFFQRLVPEIMDILDLEILGIVFGIVLVLGMFISWICTTLAVRKYLRLDADRLY